MNSEYVELPSGLIVPRDCAPRRRPTCVDLFCGCGGMSLGVIQAGMEVVAAVDWDCPSAHTYMNNLGSYPINIHGIEDEDYDRFADYLERQFKRQKPGDNGLFSCPTSGSGWISHYPEVPPVRHFFIGDVRKLTGRRILDAVGLEPGELDCVCGGPPCHGSRSGAAHAAADGREDHGDESGGCRDMRATSNRKFTNC